MNFSFLKSFRNRVLAGLLLIVPLWVTLIVARLLLQGLDSLVSPMVDRLNKINFFTPGAPNDVLGTSLEYLFVILLAVLLLYLIGLFSTSFLVRRLYAIGERVLLHIPLLKTTYVMTKQVVELVSAKGGSNFKEVVSVEFPKADSYVLAFVTGRTRHSDDARPFVNVFVPTTPNPTSGFMLMVPRDAVKNLDLSVEDAVKMLMSGGAITPEVIGSRALDAEDAKAASREGAGGPAESAPSPAD